jgi:hypothetical protein
MKLIERCPNENTVALLVIFSALQLRSQICISTFIFTFSLSALHFRFTVQKTPCIERQTVRPSRSQELQQHRTLTEGPDAEEGRGHSRQQILIIRR